jgi:hypothetical protein
MFQTFLTSHSFHFTDSFFEQENDTNIELSINIDETNQQSVFEELKDVKKKHPRKFIVARYIQKTIYSHILYATNSCSLRKVLHGEIWLPVYNIHHMGI